MHWQTLHVYNTCNKGESLCPDSGQVGHLTQAKSHQAHFHLVRKESSLSFSAVFSAKSRFLPLSDSEKVRTTARTTLGAKFIYVQSNKCNKTNKSNNDNHCFSPSDTTAIQFLYHSKYYIAYSLFLLCFRGYLFSYPCAT